MDFDADEAARKAYFEYLTERFKDDAAERRHREDRFNNGHPHPRDMTAIQKARDAYVQAAGTGQALDAARDALYGAKDREQIFRREVDPERYHTNPDYHNRMNTLIAEKVEQERQQRLSAKAGLNQHIQSLDDAGRSDRAGSREALEQHFQATAREVTGSSPTPPPPPRTSRKVERERT